jgi:hypothetical protein
MSCSVLKEEKTMILFQKINLFKFLVKIGFCVKKFKNWPVCVVKLFFSFLEAFQRGYQEIKNFIYANLPL